MSELEKMYENAGIKGEWRDYRVKNGKTYAGKNPKNRNIRIMKSSDRQALSKLPKKITVYRGCKDKTDEKKWNWSTDKSFVEKYISTMGEGWYIAEKTIDKQDIFAYFNSRKESEVILKPKEQQ